MIDVQKFLSGKYDINCSVELQLYSCRGSASSVETRGNSYKLVPDRSKYELRRHYFSHRVVSVWNILPDTVVCAKSVNSFKSRLDKFWSTHDEKSGSRSFYPPRFSLQVFSCSLLFRSRTIHYTYFVIKTTGNRAHYSDVCFVILQKHAFIHPMLSLTISHSSFVIVKLAKNPTA